MAVDHDGKGLYSKGFGHGDAGHLSDMDPTRPGLEFLCPTKKLMELQNQVLISRLKTGEVIWRKEASGDIGRGICMDIDPNYYGYECWASGNLGCIICGDLIYSNFPNLPVVVNL